MAPFYNDGRPCLNLDSLQILLTCSTVVSVFYHDLLRGVVLLGLVRKSKNRELCSKFECDVSMDLLLLHPTTTIQNPCLVLSCTPTPYHINSLNLCISELTFSVLPIRVGANLLALEKKTVCSWLKICWDVTKSPLLPISWQIKYRCINANIQPPKKYFLKHLVLHDAG